MNMSKRYSKDKGGQVCGGDGGGGGHIYNIYQDTSIGSAPHSSPS